MKVFSYRFYVYIVTCNRRSVLYIGVSNDLSRRLLEHHRNRGNPLSFTGRYLCDRLVYYEEFRYIRNAIAREKEIKLWDRNKKNTLITACNPEWVSLNHHFIDKWPPEQETGD